VVIDLNTMINHRHKEFFQTAAPLVIFYGGAGAGKSYSAVDKIIIKIINESKRHGKRLKVLVVRRSMPSLKRSCLDIFLRRLDKMHLPYDLNRADMVMRFPDLKNSQIVFLSVNDDSEIEKVKSITDVDLIWIEEANEISVQAYGELLRRLRGGESSIPQVIMTLNPINTSSWVYALHWEKPSTADKIHVTVDDNPFATPEYVAQLDGLKDVSPNQYKVYRLGEWGQLTGAIYTNWTTAREVPAGVKDTVIGLDFGYPNTTAAVRVHILPDRVVLQELIYEEGLANQDLIARLRDCGVKKGELIYADTADQNRIEEIRRAGFTITDADKTVHDGILFMQGLRVQILDGSANVEKEAIAYSWAKDRHGRTLEVPVKFRDHCVTGDTLVETTSGPRRIEELVGTSGSLFSWDGEKEIPAVYHDVRLTRKDADVIEIIFEDGRVLKCTSDHLILTTMGWIEAGKLTSEHDVIDSRKE